MISHNGGFREREERVNPTSHFAKQLTKLPSKKRVRSLLLRTWFIFERQLKMY